MLDNKYYLILAFTKDRDCPSFVTITKDGYMIQSNIYDATKFIHYNNIFEYLEIVKNKFKEYMFEITDINSKIFGENARFVLDKEKS